MVFWLLKKYDSQIVLRSTVYRKSMAGFTFIWSYFGPEKKNLYQNFKCYNAKGFASLSIPPSPLGFVP
jgi:hypothetical protein